MRQYELEDCVETEYRVGQKLKVVHIYQNADQGSGETDVVVIFGNPETKKSVFVPFNSKVRIEDNIYTVIRGEPFEGRRSNTYNCSPKCLLDKEGKLHSLEDFFGKQAVIIK
jgi:hypothetical protein